MVEIIYLILLTGSYPISENADVSVQFDKEGVLPEIDAKPDYYRTKDKEVVVKLSWRF